MKVLNVVGEAKVSGNDDGTLSVSDLKDSSGVPKKFREIAPLLFREVNGQDKLGFKRDESGNFVEAIDFPFMVFQKASLNQNSAFQIPMIITALVLGGAYDYSLAGDGDRSPALWPAAGTHSTEAALTPAGPADMRNVRDVLSRLRACFSAWR